MEEPNLSENLYASSKFGDILASALHRICPKDAQEIPITTDKVLVTFALTSPVLKHFLHILKSKSIM